MNYENLYETLQPQHKSLKESLASLQKLSKTITKETDGGDIKNLIKDLDSMAETAAVLSSALESMRAAVSGFDTKVFEMFPYRVKLDMENQDVYVDRKKVQCMRPQSLVDTIRSGQEKLNRVSFNPAVFASELADAYDTAVLKMKRQPTADIYLSSLYLARLYISRIDVTKSGRRFQFGPSRESNKSIRILDKNGQQHFLSTICFYKQEE